MYNISKRYDIIIIGLKETYNQRSNRWMKRL